MLSHLTEKLRQRLREPRHTRLRAFYRESNAVVERALLEDLEDEVRRLLAGSGRPDDPWCW